MMIHDTISKPIERRKFAVAFIGEIVDQRIHTLWNDETGETYYVYLEANHEIVFLDSSYNRVVSFWDFEQGVEKAIRKVIEIITPKGEMQ